MKKMRKLWILCFVLLVSACTKEVILEPEKKVDEVNSFFDEQNIEIISYDEFIFIDREELFTQPVDTFQYEGVYYASISDIADYMNFKFLNAKWRMARYETEYLDEYYHMWNTSNTIDMKLYYDGRVTYTSEQYYMSDFAGWSTPGSDTVWAVATIDIDPSEEIPQYFPPIEETERPEERFLYQKEFDLRNFGVKVVYEDELFLPLHTISFMMNGFEGLNYSIQNNTFYITAYEEYGTKIPMDQLILTEANKEYFISWFDFVYNEYYFSKEVYLDLYNELKIETYQAMREARNWSAFYQEFFNMLAELKDHHTYKGSLSQAQPVVASAYWSTADAHYETGGIPTNYYQADFTYEVLKDNVLWLRIGTFSNGYADEVKELIIQLEPTAVIYDVRGNTGGYIHHAYNLAGTMTNEFYTYEMDQEGYLSSYFIEMQDDVWYEGPTYVLSNELSFSAASQFIQVAKDNELATIVGESHGGGHSAVIYMYLPDGSILHISVTNVGMISESGDWIDFGTEPDIPVKDEFIGGVDQVLSKTLELIKKES